jgi:hypothetical protein
MLGKSESVLWRRIRIYLVGFIIGLISVYFMFGQRGCKNLTPGMLKLDQIATKDSVRYSDTALCEMKCQNITRNEVLESFTYGKVDSKKSKDFNQRSPMFNFSGLTQKGRNLNVVCIEHDSLVRIVYVKDLAIKDSCKCP